MSCRQGRKMQAGNRFGLLLCGTEAGGKVDDAHVPILGMRPALYTAQAKVPAEDVFPVPPIGNTIIDNQLHHHEPGIHRSIAYDLTDSSRPFALLLYPLTWPAAPPPVVSGIAGMPRFPDKLRSRPCQLWRPRQRFDGQLPCQIGNSLIHGGNSFFRVDKRSFLKPVQISTKGAAEIFQKIHIFTRAGTCQVDFRQNLPRHVRSSAVAVACEQCQYKKYNRDSPYKCHTLSPDRLDNLSRVCKRTFGNTNSISSTCSRTDVNVCSAGKTSFFGA